MIRTNVPKSELPLTLLFFGLTTIFTLGAASLCLNDSFFRSMITLSRQSDLLSQRYFGELAAEQIFADAWRGMQQAIPFRVELVEDGAVGEATSPRRDWGLVLSPLDSTLKVLAISESSPFQGSLLPNDEIVSVDEINSGLIARFSEYLQERESTYVTLRILRDELPDSLQIMVPPAPTNEAVRVDSAGSILYMEFRRLTRSAVDDVLASLRSLNGAAFAGTVVDLRAVRSSAYSAVDDLTDEIKKISNGKSMVVLVDANTVGAGEELAQRLRERSNARLLGTPTAGVSSRFEEVRLRSGRRLLVSIDERIRLGEADDSTAGDSLGSQPKVAAGAVLPDFECREPRLSPLTFELIHRGLILDFVTSRVEKTLPPAEQDEQIFQEFREFLNRRKFNFDPLGDALFDLSMHEMSPEMQPIVRNLKLTKESLAGTQLAEYRNEIMRQLLQTWYRVRVGTEPPLAVRVRFDDHCLAEAFTALPRSE